MLRFGPPQMVVLNPLDPDPLRLNDCDKVGWATMIGTGDVVCVMAATAIAFTVELVGPKNRIRVVFTVRDAVTWEKQSVG
jgi:hypothetical protein